MFKKKAKTVVEEAIEQVSGFEIICEKLTRNFVITGKAKSTLKNYLRCLAHIALHFKISPERLDKEAVEEYLFHCKNLHQTPSDSFFKHTVYGLRSLYKVLYLPDKKVALPQIKRQNDLPIVLNKSEVRALLLSPKYLRHRLILGLLYGCGLRSYELCDLRCSDIDFERKTVFVRKKKGRTDRYLPLNDMLARGLKKYLANEHPIDYLFYSQVSSDGAQHPITPSAIQWIIKESRSKINTKKKFTAHTLRHSFATHLLEDGMNILTIKELLGHSRIETTMIYLQIAQLDNYTKFSPLDTLYKK